MAITKNDYLVINIGGTPGVAGTGSYYVSSVGGVLQAGSGIIASADPTTLTVWEGDPVWHNGKPYLWDGTGYVEVNTGPHPIDYQVSPTPPATRSDGVTLPAEGDLWFDTANDLLMMHDGAAWVSVGPATGSTLVDNGDNTVTHTSSSGAVFTFTKAAKHVAAPAAPSPAFVGDTWFDTVNGVLSMYANNGTTNVWVPISSAAAASGLPFDWQSNAGDPTGVRTTRSDGTGLVDGDLCWDATNDKLYAWTGTAWSEVGGGGAGGTRPSMFDAGATGWTYSNNTWGPNGPIWGAPLPAGPAGVPGYWMCTTDRQGPITTYIQPSGYFSGAGHVYLQPGAQGRFEQYDPGVGRFGISCVWVAT